MPIPYDKDRETVVAPSQSAGAPKKPKGRDTSRLTPPPGSVSTQGDYGGQTVMRRDMGGQAPAFSNTKEGLSTTAQPDTQGITNVLENTPRLGEGAAAIASGGGTMARARDIGLTPPPQVGGLQQEPWGAGMDRSQAKREASIESHMIFPKQADKAARGDLYNKLRSEQQATDRLTTELGAGAQESAAGRRFDLFQTGREQAFEGQQNQADRQTKLQRTQMRLTPPPEYVTGDDGNLMRVQGTEAQPVSGPQGRPFQGASGDAGERQKAYLDLVTSLTPEGGLQSDTDRERVMNTANSILETLYPEDEEQDLSDLPENELITDNRTGEQFYLINGEKIPARMMRR